MKQAAVGFRVHSGWSALVTVSLENDVPRVVSRERVHLVETFLQIQAAVSYGGKNAAGEGSGVCG